MVALSQHLRPAPYPYGLLTLRLLGKLGGRNRVFLRQSRQSLEGCLRPSLLSLKSVFGAQVKVSLPLNVSRCVEILRTVALSGNSCAEKETSSCSQQIWTCDVRSLDIAQKSRVMFEKLATEQAEAAWTCIRLYLDLDNECESTDGMLGLFLALGISVTEEDASKFLQEYAAEHAEHVGFVFPKFLSQAPLSLGSTVVDKLLEAYAISYTGKETRASNEAVTDDFCSRFCEGYTSSHWSRHLLFQKLLLAIARSLSPTQLREHELRLVNAAFVVVKTISDELTYASIKAISFAVQVCAVLYGTLPVNDSATILWDGLSFAFPRSSGNEKVDNKRRPSDEVFKLVVTDLISTKQLARYVRLSRSKEF